MKNADMDPELIVAIKRRESINILTQIIERTPYSIEEAEKKFQESPIIVAINSKYMEALKLLLDKGADINKKIKETGKTAIYNAVMRRNYEAADILLHHNQIDLRIQCLEGKNTPLHCAIDLNDSAMVDILVSYAKRKGIVSDLMSIKNKNGHTPDKVSTSSSFKAIITLKEMLEEVKRDNAAPTPRNVPGDGSYIINNPNQVTINNTFICEYAERHGAAPFVPSNQEYIRPPESMFSTNSSLNFEERVISSLPDKSTLMPSPIPYQSTRVPSSTPNIFVPPNEEYNRPPEKMFSTNSSLNFEERVKSPTPYQSTRVSSSTPNISSHLDNGFRLFIQLRQFHMAYLENEKIKIYETENSEVRKGY